MRFNDEHMKKEYCQSCGYYELNSIDYCDYWDEFLNRIALCDAHTNDIKEYQEAEYDSV